MDKRKLSLAELIARKEKPLKQTAEVFVPGMGGTVEIRRLPLVEYQELSSALWRFRTLEANEADCAGTAVPVPSC